MRTSLTVFCDLNGRRAGVETSASPEAEPRSGFPSWDQPASYSCQGLTSKLSCNRKKAICLLTSNNLQLIIRRKGKCSLSRTGVVFIDAWLHNAVCFRSYSVIASPAVTTPWGTKTSPFLMAGPESAAQQRARMSRRE